MLIGTRQQSALPSTGLASPPGSPAVSRHKQQLSNLNVNSALNVTSTSALPLLSLSVSLPVTHTPFPPHWLFISILDSASYYFGFDKSRHVRVWNDTKAYRLHLRLHD